MEPKITICRDGDYTYYRNQFGSYHREDGPAIIFDDGYCQYRQSGQLHRLDGPAVCHTQNLFFDEWHIHGARCHDKETFVKHAIIAGASMEDLTNTFLKYNF